MNYQLIYHQMNQRRQIEIDLCYKSMLSAINLYTHILELYNIYHMKNERIANIFDLSSDVCLSIENAYQALLETDIIIDEICMDEDIEPTIIYAFKKELKSKYKQVRSNNLNITDIRIRRIYPNNGTYLKAIVTIIIDQCLAVHDLKIIETPDKLFVAMPSHKDGDSNLKDIVHPITAESRQEIESKILTAYHDYIKNAETLDNM